MLPTTIDARRTRIRLYSATDEDMAWARVVPLHFPDPPGYRCDCRCRCHSSSGGQLSATGAIPGSCGLRVNVDTLDCERGCRSAHILASECQLDERRGGAHV